MPLVIWNLLWTKYLSLKPGMTLGDLQDMKDLGILDHILDGIYLDEDIFNE